MNLSNGIRKSDGDVAIFEKLERAGFDYLYSSRNGDVGVVSYVGNQGACCGFDKQTVVETIVR